MGKNSETNLNGSRKPEELEHGRAYSDSSAIRVELHLGPILMQQSRRLRDTGIFKICRYLRHIFHTCKIDKRGSCHIYEYYFTHTLPNSLNSYTSTNTITPTDHILPSMKFAEC